jgi:quinol monooxygenase YgiN
VFPIRITLGKVNKLTGLKFGICSVLLDAVNRYADNLEQEPGTEAFVVSLDPEDQDVAWLVAWVTSSETFDDHRKANAFADLMKELPNLLSQPPAILRMDPLRMFIQKDLVDGAFKDRQ